MPLNWTRRIGRRRYGRGHYKRTRRRVGSIASGWKRRNKRKRGSLIARTAKANRSEIKKIKKNVDTNWVDGYEAVDENNYAGQIMVIEDITSLGGTTPQGPNQTYHYCIGTPIVVGHESNTVQAYTFNFKNGVNTRSDEWITMKSLTIKGTVIGGQSSRNTGNYANIPLNQKVYMYVILDSNPVDHSQAVMPLAGGQLWNVNDVPASLFQPTGTNPVAATTALPGGGVASNYPGGSANLQNYIPGFADDPAHLNWTNPSTMYGPNKRFKILAKKTFHCSQYAAPNTAGLGDSGHFKQKVNFSFTIKNRYKFHFKSNLAMTPFNQNILIAICSDVPHYRTGSPASGIDPPAIRVASKFRFKDH